MIAGSAIYLDGEDMQILKKHRVGISHIPSQRGPLLSRMADVQANFDIGLGTEAR